MQKYLLIMSDGTEHVVTQTLIDKIAAETHFRNNKRLGTIGDNPFRSTAFMAWSAAKRTGVVTVDWDQFLEGTDPDQPHALDVAFVDDETEAVDGVGEDTSADQPPS